MVPIATNTTTNITQLQIAASDRPPAYDTSVPLIYNLIPEASQVPSDSKYEKTNLHDLKSSLILHYCTDSIMLYRIIMLIL